MSEFSQSVWSISPIFTLVKVYVALSVFTHIAGTSYPNFVEHNGSALSLNSGCGRYFPNFSHKARFTFQMLQLSDGMRPEDDSCIDKVKKMYLRS